MTVAYVLSALFLAWCVYVTVETRRLRVERVDLRGSDDAGGERDVGVRAIFLSDLHVNMNYVRPSRLRRLIETEKPDLLLLGGDYVNKKMKADPGRLARWLEASGIAAFGRSTGRAYACPGNHDARAFRGDPVGYAAYVDGIRACGVVWLEGSSALADIRGTRVSVTGFPAWMPGHPPAAFAAPPPAGVTVALAHNPDAVLDMPEGAFDLVLSGHFHGGQIWAPFDLEYRLLRKERLCRAGIRRGLHRVNGMRLYIGRGLGNVVFPFRFLSPPEATVLTLPEPREPSCPTA